MVDVVEYRPLAKPDSEPGGVYIALGSNVGDRHAHVRGALRELAAHGDVRLLRVSSLIESRPVGGPPGQSDYVNAVAEIDTALSPRALLDRLQGIEAHHGRVRQMPNGPRTLDLDLLLYRHHVIDEADLTVPHPRMWEREFVLRPLAEICPPARFAALSALRGPNVTAT